MIILYNTTNDIYVSSQVIGYIAGLLVISYNIPQLIRMIRTKSTDDVELLSLIFQMILNVVYVTYGTLMQEIPLIISESLAFIICSSMVILKKMYDKKKIANADANDDANANANANADADADVDVIDARKEVSENISELTFKISK